MDFWWLLLKCLWLILPAGIANTAPVLIRSAWPIDFNRKFLGNPLLGSHKTWRGLIIGTVAGTLVFLLQQWLYQFSAFERMSLVDYSGVSFFYGFLMASGALLGDIIKSFFKRRLGIRPGKNWFPFDNIDWIIGALSLSGLMHHLPWQVWLAAIGLGTFMHLAGHRISVFLKIKTA